MAQAKDLPNDFDGSVKPNSPSKTTPERSSTSKIPLTASSAPVPFPFAKDWQRKDGTTPALPPQMASVKSHTADEIVQMMNRTPLFMTSLEETGSEDGDNVELEALRALQYEGTPAEVAQGFKEQGNEMTKAKLWNDGRGVYTKGLAVLAKRKKDRSTALHGAEEVPSSTTEEAEIRKENALEEACYVNRALCNLELKNYRSTTLDCASALRLNPQNVKAYYRSSLALLALDKLSECFDTCSRGLLIDPSNTALKTLASKIEIRKAADVAAKEKKREREQILQKERSMLNTALRARNIRTRNTAQPPDMEDASIHLSPDPLSPTSTLNFPVVLLYPLHAQSDFIKAISEMDTIPQHLEYIFPLPWDDKYEYNTVAVELYIETGNGGLIKVGKNVSLGKVLGTPGVEVVDGLVRINVVLKDRSKDWIEEMKARKAK